MMSKQLKSGLWTVGTIMLLISVGSAIAHYNDALDRKADKMDVYRLQARITMDSIRNEAYKQDILEKLSRIDSSTSRTYDCLADLLNQRQVRYCK